MVRIAPAARTAASGELSELMYGRTDFVRYQTGLRRCRGFMVLPEGPITRLPGTECLGQVKDDAPGRLMAFVFRDEDAMLLEWTDRTLRFWRRGQRVLDGSSPYEIATPYPASRLAALQSLQSADRIYLTEGQLHPQRLSRSAIDDWSIEDTPFEGGPFAPRNLDETLTIQASDVTGSVTLTASSALFQAEHVGVAFELREIDTSSVPEWSADAAVSVNDRTYYNGNLYRADAVGSLGKTGVNPPVHSEGKWLSEKEGVTWEFLSDGAGIARITAVASATSATATVEKRLPDGLTTTASYRWAEGAWSKLRGYPRAIGAFESRHIYGGTVQEPRTLWKSVLGGTVDMTAGPLEDDGFSYILRSSRKRLGEIRALADAGDVLHVFTSADEFVGTSTDADRAFSRETASYVSDTAYGIAADTEPVVIDGQPLFVHKNTRQLMSMTIDPQSGKFRGDTLTQIARHILGAGCSKIVYQEEPVPCVWGRLDDGQLVGMTYVPIQQVVGFHVHNLAGGSVEDLEVMPSDDGKREELWLLVRRDINGATRRFIERLQRPFVDLEGTTADVASAWHQFCAIHYRGPAATTIAGLEHLEGQTVTAWTEHGAFAGLVVAEGAITLPRAATSAIVGLDATDSQMIETLDIVAGAPDGGDEGRVRTHRAMGFRVHRTAGGTVQVIGKTDGRAACTRAQPIFNRDALEAPSLRDGVFEVAGHKGWDAQKYLRFRPQPGAPLTLVSWTPTLMMADS